MPTARIPIGFGLAAYLFLLTGGYAWSQEKSLGSDAFDEGHTRAEMNEQRAVLRERDRASMHHGSPLTIVGVEQGDNDLRSRTPALMQSDRVSAHLDPDAAYQRKLALYEPGSYLPEVVAPAAEPRTESAAEPKPAGSDASAHKVTSQKVVLQWVLSLLISAVIFVLGYKRFLSQEIQAEA